VTLDYQQQYANQITEQRNLLVKIVNSTSIGISENKVRGLIDSVAKDSSFEKEKDELVAAQISFLFKEGKLTRIDVDSDWNRGIIGPLGALTGWWKTPKAKQAERGQV